MSEHSSENALMWMPRNIVVRWHILSTPLEADRGISAETCGFDDAFPPDDLGSGPYAQFIIIYIPCIIDAF